VLGVTASRQGNQTNANVNVGPADASAQVPAASNCDNSAAGLLSAQTRSPLSSEVFVGGGIAGSLLAGALAVKRWRNAS
jgi:hypothetical protein